MLDELEPMAEQAYEPRHLPGHPPTLRVSRHGQRPFGWTPRQIIKMTGRDETRCTSLRSETTFKPLPHPSRGGVVVIGVILLPEFGFRLCFVGVSR